MQRACGVMGRVVLIAILGLHSGACMSWKTQSVAPDQVMAKHPDQVRVTLGNGSRIVIADPTIIGDSLIGSAPSSDRKRAAPRRAVLLSDVQSMQVHRVNAGRTTLLIAGVGATAVVVAAAATWDGPLGSGSSNSGGDGGDSGGGGVGWGASCPLVYSWDGNSWRLDSGTFGGAVAPALARTDLDNLIYATARNGVLRLRVANELNETDYLDALSVLAVDHPPGLTVAPDGDGRIYALGKLAPPLSARDDRGGDALPRVRTPDGWGWESDPSGRDTSRVADIRDGLELTFLNPGTREARLVLDGSNTPWAAHLTQELVAAHGRNTRAWYDSLGAYPALARGLGEMMMREAFLGVSVWSGGKWKRQGYVWEAGPEIMKRQVFPLDLSGVKGERVRVRLESAPSFWLIDHVALGAAEHGPVEVRELRAESAVDQSGADVAALISSLDHGYYVMENGVSAELRFQVPEVPAGRVRSYLVRSSGWYRIHAAEVKAPDIALLRKVLTEPNGASRVAVGRMNDAMLALGARP
jgi:hypothetical protein